VTPAESPLPDPNDILTSRRLGAAIGSLADPAPHRAVHLDEQERLAIRQALHRSAHPLAGFANHLLDDWGQLADDDRAAGLLLFAQLTRHPDQERNLDTGRGVER